MTETEPYSQRVAGEVRYWIAHRAIRKGTVAQALGMTANTWSKRYKGDSDWRLDELEQIAECIGVPLARLLGVETQAEAATDERRRPDLGPLGQIIDQLAAESAKTAELLGRLRAEVDRLASD